MSLGRDAFTKSCASGTVVAKPVAAATGLTSPLTADWPWLQPAKANAAARTANGATRRFGAHSRIGQFIRCDPEKVAGFFGAAASSVVSFGGFLSTSVRSRELSCHEDNGHGETT